MHRMMSIAAAVALAASAAGGSAEAAAAPYLNLKSVAASDSGLPIEEAQYYWGGRSYCWYPNGWRGPGWYWCGYAFRQGYGWGGAYGWNGWRRGGRGGGGRYYHRH